MDDWKQRIAQALASNSFGQMNQSDWDFYRQHAVDPTGIIVQQRGPYPLADPHMSQGAPVFGGGDYALPLNGELGLAPYRPQIPQPRNYLDL